MKKIVNPAVNLSLLFFSLLFVIFTAVILFFSVFYIKDFYAEKYLQEIAKPMVWYINGEKIKDNIDIGEYKIELSAELSKLCKLYSEKIEFAVFSIDISGLVKDKVAASEYFNFDESEFSKIIKPLILNSTVSFWRGIFLKRELYVFNTILDETGILAGVLGLYIPDTKILKTGVILSRFIFITGIFFILLLIILVYITALKPVFEAKTISNDIKKEVDVIENSLNIVMGEFEKKNNEFYQSVNKLILFEKGSVKIVMASAVSHELKNYLVPLQGYVILLQKLINNLNDEGVKQKAEKYFSIINSQIVKMDCLSKSLSNVSRPSDLDYHPVNLNKLIINTVKMVHAVKAKYAGYELVIDENRAVCESKRKIIVVSCENAPMVNGDAYSLSQLIIALLSNSLNSVEYEHAGEITVGMRRLPDSGEFGFYVKDTGTGMKDEIKEFAFEPYLTTIDKNGFGTGMGFVRIVASRHDARIEFHSDLQTGTEVIIWFPPEEQIG